jgi:diguanylate cyclase (GGDEF)-like protein
VLLAALALLFGFAGRSLLSLAGLGAMLTAATLMLVVRLIPVAWTRERPLTLAAPVTFAVMLWMGPGVAMSSALLACWLQARFRPTAGYSRGEIRFEGAALALSAFVGSVVLSLSAARLGLPSVPMSRLVSLPESLAALQLLIVTALSAAGFTFVQFLLSAPAAPGARRRAAASRKRFGGQALVSALGMLPVVLLAPLGAENGLRIALPLTVLLLLGALAARLYLQVTDLRVQLRVAEAMGRASVTDPADLDPAVLLEHFLKLAKDLVTADRSLVWTLDSETGLLTPTAGLPDTGEFTEQRVAYGEGLIGRAAARMRPRRVGDASRDPQRGHREAASGAWLLYPLVVHERVLGVAQWIRPVGQPFAPEEVARLAALVPQAAVALENTRTRKAMLTLAATDGLTGLWNQRRIKQTLRDEIKRAARYRRAFSVLMLDVDSFKTINDNYGHLQGDQLLRAIARVLRGNVRSVDSVGRYGGEEFLIVLPETSKDDACRMAERIRSAVEEQAVVLLEERTLRRTVSVGVASYPEDALNADELLQRADEALYRAKREGKNRVTWA